MQRSGSPAGAGRRSQITGTAIWHVPAGQYAQAVAARSAFALRAAESGRFSTGRKEAVFSVAGAAPPAGFQYHRHFAKQAHMLESTTPMRAILPLLARQSFRCRSRNMIVPPAGL